ncbi:MAG: hypothetical protein A2Y97_02105 [Nitrospirae bacterium RBG_13_39_12]|nr:MAG: hypothetical protein A2Y97_02105 [Nitrospirae bacterium RBG_13_39_12]
MINPHVHVPYHRIEDYLHFFKKNSINLEIYFSSNSLDTIKDSDIISLRKNLDYNPSLSIHAPFMDLSPGAVDSKVRDVTKERFSHVFEIAGILMPKTIVFHSGYEKWRYAKRVDIWLKGCLKTWPPFIEMADDIGTKIAIENIFEDDPTNLKLLMEELSSENFGICFDTGHFNLFSRVPLEEWLIQLKSYFVELHLHDNNRTFDDHLAIGEGTFDFDTLFSVIKDKNIVFTLEAHTPEDTLKSIQKLYKYT